MVTPKQNCPVILALSAHDPSGAAGIQADIETINQHNCRCVSVITALTTQNTGTFKSILPQNPVIFRSQAELLLSDIKIDACKIGLIGSELLVYEIADILNELNTLPIVVDPVLHSGSGTNLSSEDLISILMDKLIPSTTVLTPNVKEAIALSGKADPADAASFFIEKGCKSVLVTGADQSTDKVVNVLYLQNHEPVKFSWERLDGIYHGSGCTLAAAISTELAMGNDIVAAIKNAQKYTIETLKQAEKLGASQLHPRRHLK